MFTKELSMAIPGDYPMVFENCVRTFEGLSIGMSRFRVKSANSQIGVISGYAYTFLERTYRLDITVRMGGGACIVQARSDFVRIAVTDWGGCGKIIDSFFTELLQRITSSNSRVLTATIGPQSQLPSSNYTAKPLNYRFADTSGGQVARFIWLIVFSVLLLSCVVSVFGLLIASAH